MLLVRNGTDMQSPYDNAVAQLKLGNIEDAIREFRLILAESPDDNWKATLLLSEARCYSILGRLDDADRVLGEISKLTPIDDAVRMNVSFVVAFVMAQREEHKKAALEYENTLREYTNLWDTAEYRDVYEDICFRRAIEVASSGEYREAVQFFKKAALFSTLKAENRQEVHSWLGICYEELRENDRAIQEFLHAIEFNFINSREAEIRYRIARLYFDRGGFAQAKHQLETIIKDYGEVAMAVPLAYIYEQLSRACHYLGENENAKRYALMSKDVDND